jgi:hypothetical protein
VVIAIIALLVSILLPSLQKAKESAKTVYCKTNMRAVVGAVENYAMEENDKLVWYRVKAGGSEYPNGEFFTNMLVRKGVIGGQNLHDVSAADDYSAFRCPNGLDENNGGAWDGGTDMPNTHPAWKKWWYDPGLSSSDPEVLGLAVRTWYSLNAINESFPKFKSPFRIVNKLSQAKLDDPSWRQDERYLKDIGKASSLVLLFEGSRAFQGAHANYIAANHPPYTSPMSGGSNMAFFDQHVETFDTSVFSEPGTNLVGTGWVEALERNRKPFMRWSEDKGTRR